MPADGWVIDFGANCGLFSVWAAVAGAQVVAVEAQQGFVPLISQLAEYNGVSDRVHAINAFASGSRTSGSAVGSLSDDSHWSNSSHSVGNRPADISVPQVMSLYHIERIGLIKMDIEGGEFAVLAQGEDLSWLYAVEQITLEVHPTFGDVTQLVSRLADYGFLIASYDNDGSQVRPDSPSAGYLYCTRTKG